MIIRKATLSDRDAIFNLLVELRRSGAAEMGIPFHDEETSDHAKQLFVQLITRPDIHIIIVEDDSNVVATCAAYEFTKLRDGYNRMVIEELVVTNEYRGRGIGTKLLNYMEVLAKDRNIKYITVATGTKLKANQFYLKHGYDYTQNTFRKATF